MQGKYVPVHEEVGFSKKHPVTFRHTHFLQKWLTLQHTNNW